MWAQTYVTFSFSMTYSLQKAYSPLKVGNICQVMQFKILSSHLRNFTLDIYAMLPFCFLSLAFFPSCLSLQFVPSKNSISTYYTIHSCSNIYEVSAGLQLRNSSPHFFQFMCDDLKIQMLGTYAAFETEINSIGTLKGLMEIRLQKRNFMNHGAKYSHVSSGRGRK